MIFDDPVSSADGDGRFGHDHGIAGERVRDLFDRGVHVAHVRMPVATPGWRSDRNEDRLRPFECGG